MSYQALARKWRPKTFDQVLGQEHVVSALVNGLDNQRVHHAFLFTGTRGVGKTTLARIFARALNCERGVTSTPCGECVACAGVDQGNFIDLIEVDAASRTKVDDTRELLDNVQYTPTQGRFKIYLIDEVHMLSTHSFNALLKTLEEPPEHVKFLLATTDPQKLPATILSRCIQFNLKSMEIGRLCDLLEKILAAESVEYDRPALLILARAANGSVRDALSLLDQGIAFGNGEVRVEGMRAMLGMIEQGFIGKLLAQVCEGRAEDALTTVAEMATRSVDFAAALDEVLSALHNAALGQVNAKALEWKGVDAGELSELTAADAELLQLLYQIALLGKRDLGLAPDPRSGFEMVLLRMIAFRPAPAAASPVAAVKPKVAAGGGGDVNVKGVTAESGGAVKSAGNGAGVAAGGGEVKHVYAKSDATIKVTGNGVSAAAAAENGGNGSAGHSGNGVGETTANYPAAAPTPSTPPMVAADLQNLRDGESWAAFIEKSGLRGLERETLMHMSPLSVDGNQMKLTLDADYAHLNDKARLAEIQRHFAEKMSLPLEFSVEVGEITAANGDTPATRENRGRREQQHAAEQAFQHDPKVQELVELFNAEVVDESIRPPRESNKTDG